MVEELKADGGIVISASHNPIEWNALKFFREGGLYLNSRQANEFLNIYYRGIFQKVRWDGIKEVERDDSAVSRHLHRVLKVIDVEAIRKKKFKVALDCCNGAGAIITPLFLEELACQVIKIHCQPNGLFPHNPEPIFINLGELSQVVKERRADIGFAQDADADRLAVISEKGQILGEEYSLALVVNHLLQKRKGKVVCNLSTSRLIDDIARRFRVPVIRTRVGEINVAETMKKEKAVIGGEGNGGIIDPRVHLGRDSLIGLGLILESMARTDKKISTLAMALPAYHIIKMKVDCPLEKSRLAIQAIRKSFSREKLDLRDGIKIDWPKEWVHIRPSGTEPVIRIIAEAKTISRAKVLCHKFISLVQSSIAEVG
jgi:phosphomannomutase